MSSRMFLLKIRPELSIIKPPHQLNGPSSPHQSASQIKTIDLASRRVYRALDVGAGIGRVTSDVLLYLFDRIDLVEPVHGFIETAKRNAIDGKWRQLSINKSSQQRHTSTTDSIEKSVRFWNQSIQSYDPHQAIINPTSLIQPLNPPFVIGPQDHWDDQAGYDIIWAQWTLGHLTDEELIDFLKKSKLALRSPDSMKGDDRDESIEGQNGDERVRFDRNGGLIIVKENIYVDPSDPDGDNFLFDPEDSSVTRSHKCFLRIFEQAGLNLIQQEIQRGFDPDLYKVHFYALQ